MRFIWVIALLVWVTCVVNAQVLYQSNTGAAFSNFIPFGPDGTLNRPAPGDHLGNQITLAGTNRLLDDIQASFGLNTNFGQNPNSATDFYTADLYKNDGAGGAPGSLFASSKVTGTNAGAAVLNLTFPFETEVPNTFTVVFSSTHPTNTAGSLAGVVGPYNAGGNPSTGSAVNTVWYNTNPAATAWVSNSSWAPSDGAATNYFTMTLDGATGISFNNGASSTTNAAVNDRAIVSNHTTASFNAGGNVSVTHFGSGVSAVIVTDTSQVINNAAVFTATISSGGFTTDVANGLKAMDNSTVTVSGGQVHGSISSGGFNINTANGLWALDSSSVTVNSGDFLGAISSGGGCTNTANGILAAGNSHLNILGGKFTGSINGSDINSSNGLSASGNSVVSITGGDFAGDTHDLFLQDNAQVMLFGTNFNAPYGSLNALTGTITGTLENGQVIDLSFLQSHSGQITLSPIPEPTSIYLAIAGLLFNLGRHKREAKICI